jgi:hypothetical protein
MPRTANVIAISSAQELRTGPFIRVDETISDDMRGDEKPRGRKLRKLRNPEHYGKFYLYFSSVLAYLYFALEGSCELFPF